MRRVVTNVFRVLLALFFVGCAASQAATPSPDYTSQESSLLRARQAFVKIEVEVVHRSCSGTSCAELPMGNWMGSGSVVKHGKDYSMVLTAAHVCRVDPSASVMFSILKPTAKFRALSVNGKSYSATVEKMLNTRSGDLCLLKAAPIPVPALRVAKHSAVPIKTYHNFAAPMGIFSPNMVPHFSGHYAGDAKFPDGDVSVYSFPLTGGSSGSPVVNEYGELLGVVHTYRRGFPHLAICTTHDVVRKFLQDD